jgi:hypothetical protein
MKKYSSRFFIAAFLVILLSSCSSPQNIPTIIINTPSPVATLTPSATPKPLVNCPQDNVDSYIDEVKLIKEEWDDTYTRASSTSRIALSSVIGELQDIRREMERVDRPECANYINDLYIIAMNSDIDSFISFLSKDSDSVVQRKMAGSQKAWDIVNAEYDKFIESPIDAYKAFNLTAEEVESSLIEPEPFVLPEDWNDKDFPNSNLIISFPSDWSSQTYGDNNQFLKILNSDKSLTILSGLIDDCFSGIESDSGRLFSLQTYLETSDYDYYNERTANTEVYSLNKAYVIEYSVRENPSDDIEDQILANVVTPDDKCVVFMISTSRDEFPQIDQLTIQEIYGSIR